jgi:hypothetical protein
MQEAFLHQARVHPISSGLAVALMVFRSSGWGAGYKSRRWDNVWAVLFNCKLPIFMTTI